jgi:hypothetical protein
MMTRKLFRSAMASRDDILAARLVDECFVTARDDDDAKTTESLAVSERGW